MGDVPISYIETAGGVRVSEDEVVGVGKHDVRVNICIAKLVYTSQTNYYSTDSVLQSRTVVYNPPQELNNRITRVSRRRQSNNAKAKQK